MQAPGEVVSGDAAAAVAAFALDALVGEAHVRALAADVRLKVMAAQVETLHRQHLPPVLEALGEVGVGMLPGRGVGHLAVVFGQTQEDVSRVGVKVHLSAVWRTSNRI